MKKGLLFIAMFLGLCLSFDTRAENFNMQEFYLDNGLQVIVIENHKAPIVQQMLFYKAGAVDEKPGQGGIAHLLEHLMFRGTTRVEGQLFNRVLEQNGAESNAFTTQDVTAYYQFMDISRLELAMFLEADRMKGLDIAKQNFATERDIVFQERKQRVDSNPTALFFEKVRNALWQEHPYANPVTGQDREIKNLTRDMAEEFYESYYAPNNAVLVLAGDIDVKTAEKLVKKYYGNIAPADFTKTEFTKLPNKYNARVEMEIPEVKVGRMVRMFAAPSLSINSEMMYAMEVLAQYLGGDENSPLYQELVVKDKAATTISVSYDGLARSYGTFMLAAIPVDDVDEDFEQKIDKAWNKVLAKLNENELTKVKQKMLADLVYLQDNPASLAQIAGYVAVCKGKLDYLNNYAENIEKITVDDLRSAAEYLQNDAPKVTGILRPERKIEHE